MKHKLESRLCARHGVEKLVMKKLQKYENMFIMQHNVK